MLSAAAGPSVPSQRTTAFRSLRAQLLLWFGGLMVAVVAASVAYLGYGAAQAVRKGQVDVLHSTAVSAVDLLASNLHERELEIDLMARNPLLTHHALDGSETRELMDLRLESHDEYAWIGVADVTGKVLSATNDMLIGQSVAQRPWFKAGLQGPFTGDIHEAVLLAELFPESTLTEPLRFLDVVSPIRGAKGELRGVLGSHIHWHWVTRTVEDVVRRSTDAPGVELVIADRAGKILYPFERKGMLSLPEASRQGASAGLMRWADGKDYLTSMVTIPATRTDLGWQIVLRQPEQIVLEPLHALYRQLALFGVLLLLGLGILTTRFARRLGQPLEDLVTAARRIDQGDLSARAADASSAPQDIAQLAQAFNAMAASLQVHQAELERKVAERTLALSASEADFRLLAENASDVVYRGNGAGELQWVSPSVMALTGWSATELIGQPFADYVHPDDLPTVQEARAQLHKGQSARFEVRIRTHEGQYLWVSISARPVFDADGAVSASVGGWRDIEAAVQNRRALADARDAADRANRAKSDFLATVSHEIRTPMNAILGFGATLAKTSLEPVQREHLAKVQGAATNLLRLINDILDHSKIEAGHLELESAPFGLQHSLEQVQGLFTQQLREKQLRWQQEVDADVPRLLQGDSLRLEQVLINLLGNAIKFTAAGAISLKVQCLERNADRVKLGFAVRDTGIGMQPDQVQHLFQAYTQADSSISRKFGGTGLGLSIARQLVGLMQGEISAQSEAGVGSCFSFSACFGVLASSPGDPEESLPASGSNALRPSSVQLPEPWNTNVQVLRHVQVAVFLSDTLFDSTLEGWLQEWGMRCTRVSSLDQLRAAGSVAQERPAMLVVDREGLEGRGDVAWSQVQALCQELGLPVVVFALAKPDMPGGDSHVKFLPKPMLPQSVLYGVLQTCSPQAIGVSEASSFVPVLQSSELLAELQDLCSLLQFNNMRALTVVSRLENRLAATRAGLLFSVVTTKTRELDFSEAEVALEVVISEWKDAQGKAEIQTAVSE